MQRCVCGSAKVAPVVCRKDGFDITKCGDCGTGRTVVADFDPATFYNEQYFTGAVYRDYVGSQDTLRREFRGQADVLKSLLPNGGKLLEIGCAQLEREHLSHLWKLVPLELILAQASRPLQPIRRARFRAPRPQSS